MSDTTDPTAAPHPSVVALIAGSHLATDLLRRLSTDAPTAHIINVDLRYYPNGEHKISVCALSGAEEAADALGLDRHRDVEWQDHAGHHVSHYRHAVIDGTEVEVFVSTTQQDPTTSDEQDTAAAA